MKQTGQQLNWMEKRRKPGNVKSSGTRMAKKLLKQLDKAKGQGEKL